MPGPQQPKAAHWSATINNPTGPLVWTDLEEFLEFLVYQKESAPETGTEHFQVYFKCRAPQRLSAIKKWPGFETAHLEKCKGTPEQNIAYCTKEESRLDGPWEFGDRPAPKGTRNDLVRACNTLATTKSLKRVAEEHPTSYVKYYRGFEQLMKKICPKVAPVQYALSAFNHEPLDLTKTVVIFGASNIGKTEFALAHFKSPLLVRHLDRLGDFDASVHDGIVFDDMSFTHFPLEARIHLADMDHDSDIHIRYVCACIPAGTKRIFSHNTGDVFTKRDEEMSEAQAEAISRRINYYGPLVSSLF